MKHIQKIRKLIYNLLINYYNKELEHSANTTYYTISTNKYTTEFECLSNEKRIGIYTKLNKINSLICLHLLEMLYERKYKFLLFIYLKNDFIESLDNINFFESLDNTKLWKKLLKNYFKENKIKLDNTIDIPLPLKNYKAKKPQKFYEINEIINSFYPNKIDTI